MGAEQLHRRNQLLQLNTFLKGSTHLFDLCWHLHTCATVEDGHFVCTSTQGRACGIQCCAPTADDSHIASQACFGIQVKVFEEGGGGNDAFPDQLAGDIQSLAALRPHC